MSYVQGAWKAVCDRCGSEVLNTALRREWNGLRTCPDCWEPRHPQDYLRGRKDNQAPPWTRPEPPDVETGALYWDDVRSWVDVFEWTE
jgi:hypothetical protein